jgi:hypothetical protein
LNQQKILASPATTIAKTRTTTTSVMGTITTAEAIEISKTTRAKLTTITRSLWTATAAAITITATRTLTRKTTKTT